MDDKYYLELYKEFCDACVKMRKSICWAECYTYYSQIMGVLYFAVKTELLAMSSFNNFHMALKDVLEDKKTWFMVKGVLK